MRKRTAPYFAVFCIAAALFSGCSGPENSAPQNGGESHLSSGWQQIDGQTCYIFDDGTMATGWQEIDGSRYYFRSNGTQVTGWLSLDGQKYFLGSDGSFASGVCSINGTLYVFDSDGLMTSGWAEAGGKRYYGDENCHPLHGWQEIDDTWYYFGDNFAACTGWQEINGITYYFLEDGAAARGRLTIDGEQHCFASNGQQILLVNPWNHVPEDYTVELTDIGDGHCIASSAYADLMEMLSDCKAAGLHPSICSSYRTQEYQESLFQKKKDSYLKLGFSEEDAIQQASTIVALPGTSEHQLGLAVDIIDAANNRLDESQAKMPTQKWLMANSWRYGWILRYPDGTSESTGIIYEPWHYRHVGREIAAEIYESGLCLEDYLDMLTEQ